MIFLDQIDSTNRYANEHFSELEDGTLVAAGMQTAGRGRVGRPWLSPAGANIYASFVMKQVKQPYLATAAASLAVLRLLREQDPDHDFYLKWPNDVYCGMNKICGILSEGVLNPSGGGFAGIIAGAGVNVNSSADELSGAGQAISLSILTGHHFSVKNLLFSLEKYLNACYIIYLNTPDKLFFEWKSENRLIGRILEFETPSGQRMTAELHDIADDGDALLLPENGKLQKFSCGDVRILKNTLTSNPNKTKQY